MNSAFDDIKLDFAASYIEVLTDVSVVLLLRRGSIQAIVEFLCSDALKMGALLGNDGALSGISIL